METSRTDYFDQSTPRVPANDQFRMFTLTLPEALKRAIAAYNDGKFSEAERLCRTIIAAKPDFFDALHLLAVVETRLGRLKDALTSYDRALAVRPDYAEALSNRGATLDELRRFEDALASYDQALRVRPNFAEALSNRGLTLHELKRFDEALASYDQALRVRPNYAEALSNRGLTLHKLKRFDEALASYEQALTVRPNYAEALHNRGVSLHELKRFDEALASYEQALTVRPNYAEALSNRGATLHKLKRLDEALASYEQALTVRPNYAEALIASRHRPQPIEPSPERRLFEALLRVRETASDATPFIKYCANNMDKSHAQFFQDLLVLFLLKEKRDGYFIEFGVMDGITLSNTFLLESKYSWRGIAAEPARCWHQELRRNRTCSLDHRCVWSKSGEILQFNETPEAEFSTIDALSNSDRHAEHRKEGNRYTVETISLRDLLRAHDAPRSIDYLSIDTEGSEFAILNSFFPTQHKVRIITVEHNYTGQRLDIHSLLTSWGYTRMFEELSMWDDWYIKSDLFE